MAAVAFIIALVLFVLRAFGADVSAIDLGWLGLAFLAGGLLLDAVPERHRA